MPLTGPPLLFLSVPNSPDGLSDSLELEALGSVTG